MFATHHYKILYYWHCDAKNLHAAISKQREIHKEDFYDLHHNLDREINTIITQNSFHN